MNKEFAPKHHARKSTSQPLRSQARPSSSAAMLEKLESMQAQIDRLKKTQASSEAAHARMHHFADFTGDIVCFSERLNEIEATLNGLFAQHVQSTGDFLSIGRLAKLKLYEQGIDLGELTLEEAERSATRAYLKIVSTQKESQTSGRDASRRPNLRIVDPSGVTEGDE